MATATALALQVAQRVRDRAQKEITPADYLSFINQAIDDLTAEGWLQPMSEDTSLTIVVTQYAYAVPAGFAYIRRLIVANANGDYPLEDEIPKGQWYINEVPDIYFYPDLADFLIEGRALKIIGQKRPSGSILGSDTIVPGMESFVRERAVSYAWEYLAGGVSELGQVRLKLSETNWQKSERMLAFHPMEFRVKADSIYVPGR